MEGTSAGIWGHPRVEFTFLNSCSSPNPLEYWKASVLDGDIMEKCRCYLASCARDLLDYEGHKNAEEASPHRIGERVNQGRRSNQNKVGMDEEA